MAQKTITRVASERVAKRSFELARLLGRKKVTAVHKADILKQTDGLFLDSCRQVAQSFPDIEYNEVTIDTACMELVLRPTKFDVIVAPNLYGDIISDVAAGLVGVPGLIGAANVGDGPTVYEAIHGSAPDIAGKGIANPLGLVMAATMMLRDLGKEMIAERIETTIIQALKHKTSLTPDLGGSSTTEQFTTAIIKDMQL